MSNQIRRDQHRDHYRHIDPRMEADAWRAYLRAHAPVPVGFSRSEMELMQYRWSVGVG